MYTVLYNIVSGHIVTATSCSNNWYKHNDNCFYLSTNETNQPTARDECKTMGANLTSISDQAEYDFVRKRM